jgi:hypothetical protein
VLFSIIDTSQLYHPPLFLSLQERQSPSSLEKAYDFSINIACMEQGQKDKEKTVLISISVTVDR